MDPSEEFDFYADTFNGSDVANRLEFLQGKVDDDDERLDEFEQAEYEDLKSFYEDISADSMHDEYFINENYFTEYAQQYAEDIGAIDGDNYSWPASYIDWDTAARDLQTDYTGYDLRGTTFYTR